MALVPLSHRPRRFARLVSPGALRLAFAVAAVVAAPGMGLGSAAQAQSGAAEVGSPGALEREIFSLQQQLSAVNAEVRALKQGPRNLSTDYRLRQRLADAESLGRKLTDAEARLRAQRRKRGETVEAPLPMTSQSAPRAEDSDGPAELAAKADILLDQASKLVAQADRLEQRAERERQRSTLRARARHLEQDPFIGLESSKRNLAFSSRSTPTRGEGVPLYDSAGDDKSGGAESAPPPAAPTGSSDGVASPEPQTGGSPTAGSSGGSRGPAAPPLPGDAGSGSISIAFRALLDAGNLAQIERIEGSGDPRARAKALEAVVSALRRQARDLQSQARALNTRR